jgi:hypothetical protein
MRLSLITLSFFLIFVSCSNGRHPENPKYATIHKLWKFKKDVRYGDTSVILHFSDYQTTYLDLRSKSSITFDRNNGQSISTDYYIAGDTIFGQYHNTHGKYAIIEFNNKKLSIVKLPDNGDGLNKANKNLIEIVFEADN